MVIQENYTIRTLESIEIAFLIQLSLNPLREDILTKDLMTKNVT